MGTSTIIISSLCLLNQSFQFTHRHKIPPVVDRISSAQYTNHSTLVIDARSATLPTNGWTHNDNLLMGHECVRGIIVRLVFKNPENFTDIAPNKINVMVQHLTWLQYSFTTLVVSKNPNSFVKIAFVFRKIELLQFFFTNVDIAKILLETLVYLSIDTQDTCINTAGIFCHNFCSVAKFCLCSPRLRDNTNSRFTMLQTIVIFSKIVL
mmetsp:Transcript_15890/g.21797  ORF Transcript_15890/g.21797 Transcript_15890/m.21797 type:complete len:208 (+) Transcript_15890:104-727(+)